MESSRNCVCEKCDAIEPHRSNKTLPSPWSWAVRTRMKGYCSRYTRHCQPFYATLPLGILKNSWDMLHSRTAIPPPTDMTLPSCCMSRAKALPSHPRRKSSRSGQRVRAKLSSIVILCEYSSEAAVFQSLAVD